MQSYFNLSLDTLPPSGLTVSLNDNAIYTTSATVTLKVVVTDEDTTGYQMKVWGVAGAETEADAAWTAYTPERPVSLTDGDGLKTVHVKVRDDVGNETAEASDDITLDTAVPVISVTGPDRFTISKVSGFDNAVASFTVDVDFVEYRVCAVPATNSLIGAGVDIPTGSGSENTSGTGTFPANTPISITINGADLEAASPGDGVKIIKIFARNAAGTWSVA